MSNFDPPAYPGDQPDPSQTPQNYPTYGSMHPGDVPGAADEPYSATAAIGWGWRKFRENAGPILAAIAAYVGGSILVGVLFVLVLGPDSFTDPEQSSEFSAANIVLNLVATLIGLYVAAAFYRAALDVADGKRFDFFRAFGRVNLLYLIAMTVLLYIMVVIGFILLILPGIAVIFFSYFSTFAVVDGLGPVASLKRSFSIVGKNFGGSVLLAILTILVVLLGALALLVGLIVAYPVVGLAAAYTYRRFNGQPVAP